MMTDTITKVFDHFSDAENARNELLASSFPLPRVHLRVREESDLAIGAGTATNAVEGIFKLMSGSGARPVAAEHHKAAQNGIYQLSVEIDDPQQFARASVIMKRFGGVDLPFR